MNMQVYPWQKKQWNRLTDAFARSRLPHALLLAGQTGLGLEHFASCLAAKYLCTDSLNDMACGNCRSCLLFKAGNHPDVARLEPEEAGKQIKVEAIRDTIRFIQLSSQTGRGKIAIVTPAEAMNRSASNSLLKTLEEPPAGSTFVLITHQPAFLPVTIRSRCQRLDFAPTHDISAQQWLAAEISVDASRAADLLTLSRGRPLRAVGLVENDSVTKQNQVLQDLGKLDGESADVIGTAQRWHDMGAADVFEWLQSYLASMTRLKVTGLQQSEPVSVLNRDLQRLANRLDLHALMGGYELALQNYRAITGPYNLNQMGLLEEFIVYWQTTGSRKGGHK